MFRCNCLLMTINFILLKNLLQVLRTSLLLLISDLRNFHLPDHRSFILKLVFGCDCNFSVVHIQIKHMDLQPLQACVRSWQGCLFCDCTFHHQLIDWPKRNHLKVFIVEFCQVFTRSVIVIDL